MNWRLGIGLILCTEALASPPVVDAQIVEMRIDLDGDGEQDLISLTPHDDSDAMSVDYELKIELSAYTGDAARYVLADLVTADKREFVAPIITQQGDQGFNVSYQYGASETTGKVSLSFVYDTGIEPEITSQAPLWLVAQEQVFGLGQVDQSNCEVDYLTGERLTSEYAKKIALLEEFPAGAIAFEDISFETLKDCVELSREVNS